MNRRWRVAAVLLAVLVAGGLAGCAQPGSAVRQAADHSPLAPTPAALAGQPGAVERTGVTHPQGMTCGTYRFPVTLSGSRAIYHVNGVLCAGPDGFADGGAVQVLLPGGGYDHRYWLWPDASRSYAHEATSAGAVILALDPLGVGGSDHPHGTKLTYPVQAWVVHQVIVQLRHGALGVTYRQVSLAGHSMGGYIGWTVAGTWPGDVDALVVLDAAHTLYQPQVARLIRHMHPAGSDDRYRALAWASYGYMAIDAGTRCHDYYWHATSQVCAVDERLNRTNAVPLGQLVDLENVQASDLPAHVTVPVMIVVGAHDALFCGAGNDCLATTNPIRGECRHYAAAASCRVYVVPNGGHDTNLQGHATRTFHRITNWMTRSRVT